MLDEVKISVIVPVYNVEKYLSECLDSILSQGLKDIEVICVNDGSTDKSAAILSDYQRRDSRVVRIDEDNQGLSVARNAGIGVATGEYLCFVDSDDILKQGALSDLYEAAERVNADIVTFETAELHYEPSIERNLEKENFYKVKKDYSSITGGRELLCEMVENDDYVDSACLRFIRRNWLQAKHICFEVGRYYEDAMFSLQCHLLCSRMIHLHKGLYIYRVREESIVTSKTDLKHVEDRLWLLDRLMSEIYSGQNPERVVNAISRYATLLSWNIKSASVALSQEERERLYKGGNSRHMFLVDCLGLQLNPLKNLPLSMLGLRAAIKKHGGVILYGAGLVGLKVLKTLKREKLDDRIIGFAVSEMNENRVIEGIPVRCIADYSERDAALVISATENSQTAMMEKAKELGFLFIYPISSSFECCLNVLNSGEF